MHCRNCDYPLWNLKARECPECGEPFRPSEFGFVPNSVHFCCPHCDQQYYGTGEGGLLQPAEFNCVSCGQFVGVDEMVLRPAEGVAEAQTAVDAMPWFERERRGLFKAWFATIGRAMVNPASLMRAIPVDAGYGAAWCYMFCTLLIFSLVGNVIPGLVMMVIIGSVIGGFGPPGMGGALGPMMWSQMALQYGMGLAMIALLPVLWIWGTHFLLRITGSGRLELRRTWHAICYSSGADALAAVPFGCVRIGGLVWWLVSAILMLKETHKVGGGRATFATLTSGVVISVLVFGGMFALMFTMYLPGGFLGGFVTGRTETQAVTTALLTYAQTNNGSGPRHAGQMLISGELTEWELITMDSATTPDAVPLADVSLEQLGYLGPNDQAAKVQAAAAAIPADAVAHRLGDFVFTHHGLDLTTNDGQLWIVVMLEETKFSAWRSPADPVFIGRGDGSVAQISYAELPMQLSAQNAYRRSRGLPELPDLSTVTHDAPAGRENREG